MNDHGTLCGQRKPISISKAFSIHKSAGYEQQKIQSNTFTSIASMCKGNCVVRVNGLIYSWGQYFSRRWVLLPVPSVENAMRVFCATGSF